MCAFTYIGGMLLVYKGIKGEETKPLVTFGMIAGVFAFIFIGMVIMSALNGVKLI